MFGLEDDKKKGKATEEIVFDLEKELLDVVKKKNLIQLIEKRLQVIKNILRAGASQDEVNVLGHIFNGYNSLLKVVSRPVKVKK